MRYINLLLTLTLALTLTLTNSDSLLVQIGQRVCTLASTDVCSPQDSCTRMIELRREAMLGGLALWLGYGFGVSIRF